MPKALTIIQNRLSILLYAVHAATVSVPNAFTLDWIRILDDVYITDCNPAGSPIRMILWNILPSKRIFLSSRRCISFVRISTHNTSTALSACDRIVASACHTHMQSDDKHNVQHNIGQAADDQEI